MGPPPAKTASLTKLAKAGAWVIAVVYLAQYLTAPPNSTEGGVVFNYVDRFAAGQRVYFELFDYYGPVTWYLPSLFYRLGGKTILAVRVYLLLSKLVTIWIGYRFVRDLADEFHAILAAATLTALVGLPWACLQIPYAAQLVIPLAIGTWWLVLTPRAGPSNGRLALAALLTAASIWTKVSVGGFLLAGVAFHLAYWSPENAGREPSGLVTAFRVLRLLGLVAYGVLFHLFIREHWSFLFFLYLSLPLSAVLAFTAWHEVRQWRDGSRATGSLRAATVYVALTAVLAVAYLFAYFGSAAGSYLRDEAAALHALKYFRPFPRIGLPGPYLGFNEWYWPELPLLTTATLFAAVVLGKLRRNGTDGERRRDESVVVGLGAMATLEGFVVYSRAGEPQLIQAIVPSAAALFVFAYHVERVGWRGRRWPRVVLAAAVAIGLCTIFVVPLEGAYSFRAGPWTSPRLARLRFHPPRVPYFSESRSTSRYDLLDASLDAATTRIASLTTPGEEVLVLSENDLLTFASATEPVGGRYAPLFYLLRAGMLDREGFRSKRGPDPFLTPPGADLQEAPRRPAPDHGLRAGQRHPPRPDPRAPHRPSRQGLRARLPVRLSDHLPPSRGECDGSEP